MAGNGTQPHHATPRNASVRIKGVVAKSGPTYPQVKDFHRIRAALLLHELLPEDEEVTRRLQTWSTNHPEENVRRELGEILARAPGSSGA